MSPVVGVVLVTAIVVALAALFATTALGFGDELREPAPTGSVAVEYVPSGEDNTDNRPYVTITYQSGDTADGDDIYVVDGDGNSVAWSDVWTGGPEVSAGEYIHVDGNQSDGALNDLCAAGQTYRVVFRDGGRSTTVLDWTVPRDPSLPSSSSSDDDGDGIPDWC
ncbi:type IV pilin [Halomicrobium salinisoli]|uniref:type IV pilin n=1 Tax=Halomicrobium salinisoli TaxID=2878391 RepID=UPI001F0A4C46|nr:type IV pilin N-terminal domain-containing protein [Halomicrobium salinisoli]